MVRKLVVALLVVGLVASPAMAGKKKKSKKPKPYKSEEVTIAVAHPVFYGSSGTILGVTAQEFMNNCGIPASNGLDAYVFEVPEDYRKVTASVRAIGTPGGPAGYDLDMFTFDEDCQVQFAFQAANTDESGSMAPGTAYILVYNYLGDPNMSVHIELEAV